MNILFFGTPDFVLPIPESLLKAGYELAIVTAQDKPVGRHAYRQAGKKILTPSPVKSWALSHKIKVLTPEKLDPKILTSQLAKSTSDFPLRPSHFPVLGILAAYGRILPQEVINLFPKGILVIHPSLLPKYRGPSPVQSALMADDKTTGVSIIQMDKEMDHGPILTQFEEEIRPTDTLSDLYDRLFKKSAQVLVQILPDYLEGKTELKEQNHSRATYSKIIKKEDGFISWSDLQSALKGQNTIHPALPAGRHSPLTIYNLIRALTPWPGVWTLLLRQPADSEGQAHFHPPTALGASAGQAKRLKILKAHLGSVPLRPSHSILPTLVLDQVQLEGKNPVSWKQFSQANPSLKLS